METSLGLRPGVWGGLMGVHEILPRYLCSLEDTINITVSSVEGFHTLYCKIFLPRSHNSLGPV